MVQDAVRTVELPAQPLGVAESTTLLQALSAVPDPRKARGCRHSLQSILYVAVGAELAGARSYAAIAQWARHVDAPVTICRSSPHAATLAWVLGAVEMTVLQQALTRWVLAGRAGAQPAPATSGDAGHPVAEDRTVLAFDGKTLRGARIGNGGQAKLVAVFEHAHGLVFAQAEVAEGDELAAFALVLNTLPDLRGVVVTANALHCRRAQAAYLHGRGAHYCSRSKATTRPATRAGSAALGASPGADRTPPGPGPDRVPIDQGHRPGRDAGGTAVPARSAAIKVIRRLRRSGTAHPSVETVYARTSPGAPRRRPTAIGLLDPVALGEGKPAPLGPRRHRG
ncbi:transposase family protein [Modestobacter altitudinis]|uniref:transposase family protein n=1 Tax=Modestobacter altitudinis TaxID=2213158 RepID=UPI001487450C|nr:transposase family protein [Modestobacter altitudinis]